MIEALIERDHAYESGGDVYFRVRSFDGYGKLSNRDPDEMDQGEEAGTQSLKESPLDFALWKAQKPGEDTAWDSPWGEGRPGWHIECSAMAEKELGADFEIHGGGIDLVFPHHENEVAQSEGARGRAAGPHLDAQRDDPDRRREDVQVGREHLRPARGDRGLRRPRGRRLPDLRALPPAARVLRRGARGGEGAGGPDPQLPARAGRAGRGRVRREREEALIEALCDDFNTPRALAAVFELIAEANRRPVPGAREALERMLPLLGLEGLLAEDDEAGEDAQALLRERDEARAARDFERADAARDRLAELGWEVRDSAEGSKLVRRG